MQRDYGSSLKAGGGESLFSLLKHGPLKCCVLGSGNWGTACARLISQNAKESYLFDEHVKIWVREEKVGVNPDGSTRWLHEVMNEEHENVKYLPGFKLPPNLKAFTDIKEVVKDADLIAFILPHQFMEAVCLQIAGVVKPTAHAVSLAKGLYTTDECQNVNAAPGSGIGGSVPSGSESVAAGTTTNVTSGIGITTFSRVVEKICGIECSALSGANVAYDVANEQFCETTIGYNLSEMAAIWQQLFDRPHFRVHGVPDCDGVQVCGAIKNLIALAAGFCDGLGMGSNTKAAIIRIGTHEMKIFASLFFDQVLEDTFFDSCGFADVITTCFGGRNVKCAAEFIKRNQESSWEEIEADMLNGQKMQGQYTSKEVHHIVSCYNLQKYFPLFETTYKVAFERLPPQELLKVFMDADVSTLRPLNDCSASILPPPLKELRHALRKKAAKNQPPCPTTPLLATPTAKQN